MFINNKPDETQKYIVATNVNGEWWFWGSYNNMFKARTVANDIGGSVFEA